MTVFIYVSTATQLVSFVPLGFQLQLELPPPSPMQTELPADCLPTPLSMLHFPMQAIQDELMEQSPTARKSGHGLQEGTSRLSITPVSFTPFLKLCNTFHDLLPSFHN